MKKRIQKFGVTQSLALLGTILLAFTVQADGDSIAGVYLLTHVNSEELPAATWTRAIDSRSCTNETLDGALLIDTEGRMAVLATTRDVCLESDGSKKTSTPKSELFDGTYEVSGDAIELHFTAFPNEPDTGVLANGVLTVKDVGGGDFEGQIAEFIFRKK